MEEIPEIINNNIDLKKQNKKISQKKYYDKNRDRLIELQYKDVFCEACNLTTKLYRLSKHKKTAKHLKNIQKIQPVAVE